jgi:hypothetical protein
MSVTVEFSDARGRVRGVRPLVYHCEVEEAEEGTADVVTAEPCCLLDGGALGALQCEPLLCWTSRAGPRPTVALVAFGEGSEPLHVMTQGVATDGTSAVTGAMLVERPHAGEHVRVNENVSLLVLRVEELHPPSDLAALQARIEPHPMVALVVDEEPAAVSPPSAADGVSCAAYHRVSASQLVPSTAGSWDVRPEALLERWKAPADDAALTAAAAAAAPFVKSLCVSDLGSGGVNYPLGRCIPPGGRRAVAPRVAQRLTGGATVLRLGPARYGALLTDRDGHACALIDTMDPLRRPVPSRETGPPPVALATTNAAWHRQLADAYLAAL